MNSTDALLNVATTARFFHTSDGTAFADLIIDGHRETWPVRGKRFQAWLRQQYYERTWDAPGQIARTRRGMLLRPHHASSASSLKTKES